MTHFKTAHPSFIGFGIALNISFTYLVYPLAVSRLGLLKGAMAMTAVSLVLHYLVLSLYDRSGRDWFGIEELKKKIEKMEGRGRVSRLVAGAIKRSGILALIILSVKFDPFITTVYLRRGGFHGLDFRDRLIFLSSAAIGNGYCIFLMLGGGTLIRHLKSIL